LGPCWVTLRVRPSPGLVDIVLVSVIGSPKQLISNNIYGVRSVGLSERNAVLNQRLKPTNLDTTDHNCPVGAQVRLIAASRVLGVAKPAQNRRNFPKEGQNDRLQGYLPQRVTGVTLPDAHFGAANWATMAVRTSQRGA